MIIIYSSRFNKLRRHTLYLCIRAAIPYNFIMDSPLFIEDAAKLQKGLFTTYNVRQGVQTKLNINYIPDLLQYVKKLLLPEELINLIEYHVQNYLIELSIEFNGRLELEDLVNTILNHIKSNNQFWYRHNNKQIIAKQQQLKRCAIQSYQNDIKHLQEGFKDQYQMVQFVPTYPKKTSTNFCYRLLHINTETHCGTKHSLNHIAYIPRFLTEVHSKPEDPDKAKEKSADKGEKLQELKQLIQQFILFMLKNKLNKVLKKQQVISSNPSEENQQIEQQIESSSNNSGEKEEEVEEKTIIDEFIEFMENTAKIPKFQISHHMYILTHNILQACQLIEKNREKVEDNVKRIEKKVSFKKHELKDSIDCLQIPLSCQEILSSLSQRELKQNQFQTLAEVFLELWFTKLKFVEQQIENRTRLSKKGWLCSREQINKVKEGYYEMLQRPEYVELKKYRTSEAEIPWQEEDYKNFLKGLQQFFNVPTNNKKIATFMGDKIQPNHVKHIKGVYLTVMKDRMEKGECGGGKRGKCLSKSDFIAKDINSFSMKWFEKTKNIKKKNKRKRRNSSDGDNQQDMDSQY